jgi:prevent-host-death family protein
MTMVEKSHINTVAAGDFKAKCLKIMDRVSTTREPIVVTKKGKPLVKLVPIENTKLDVFGCLSDKLEIVGNIESTIVSDDDWEVLR